MKEYNWSSLSKISGVLAIVFSGIFCCSLIVDEYGMVPYNSPYWDLVYNLIWIGLVGILLFTASWFFCLSKTEYDCWKTLSKKVGVLAIAFSVLFFLPFIISALLEDAFFVIWIGLAGASIFGVLWLLSSSKSKSVKEEIKATEIKEQRKEGNSYVGPIILGIIVGLSTFLMGIGSSDNEDVEEPTSTTKSALNSGLTEFGVEFGVGRWKGYETSIWDSNWSYTYELTLYKDETAECSIINHGPSGDNKEYGTGNWSTESYSFADKKYFWTEVEIKAGRQLHYFYVDKLGNVFHPFGREVWQAVRDDKPAFKFQRMYSTETAVEKNDDSYNITNTDIEPWMVGTWKGSSYVTDWNNNTVKFLVNLEIDKYGNATEFSQIQGGSLDIEQYTLKYDRSSEQLYYNDGGFRITIQVDSYNKKLYMSSSSGTTYLYKQ